MIFLPFQRQPNNLASISFIVLMSILVWELFLRNLLLLFENNNMAEEPTDRSILEFNMLDVDNNNFLSLNEFIPYYKRTRFGEKIDEGISQWNTEKEKSVCNLESGRTDGILLTAHFKPLQLESSMKDYASENKQNPNIAKAILNWNQPHIKQQVLPMEAFKVFLPKKLEELTVGSTWWVVEPIITQESQQLSSLRYDPPPIARHLKCLERIFAMFHPRPFLQPRFNPRGILALLRASNDYEVDIYFRAHVEYQLEEPPAYPFWFTPAQFKGHLIMDKATNRVKHFKMEVPNSKDLNVDMEWMYGTSQTETMEVDLGYLPLMEINSSNLETSIEWTNFITEIEATTTMEKIFYPFKAVPYLNITEAFQSASNEDKLVHAIILYGSLDDQSC